MDELSARLAVSGGNYQMSIPWFNICKSLVALFGWLFPSTLNPLHSLLRVLSLYCVCIYFFFCTYQPLAYPFTKTRMSEYYEVYLVRHTLAMPDPDVPGPRFHTSIFVKTAADKSGIQYHVTGDITSANGMVYNPQPKGYPEDSQSFHSLEKLGVTPVSSHPADWDRVLGSVPAPHQQKAFNTKTMKTEPFKTKAPLAFYGPGEPRRPLIKCTEWTLERALPALRANGLIIQL